jgi:signal transduction histidine kinase
MNRQTFGWSGKYRDLIIAIGLFLVLDLGVLAFNVYTSRQIESDTAQLNAGGELRMYSQQLTKALLTLQSETAAGLPNQTSMAQITESHEAFRAALLRLKQASISDHWTAGFGGQDGSVSETQQLLRKVETYWEPMDEVVAPLRATPDPSAEDVEIATSKFVSRNLRLMYLADDLAQHLETTAITRAALLRQIQFIAILLALLNFVFIIAKFVRRLRESDRAVDAARKEVVQILDTVHEGLFLVTRDGQFGEQRSASLDMLFGRPLRPGEGFRELLRTLVSPEEFETARQYLDLLFNDKIKASLMEQLNPLKEVGVTSPHRHPTYLDFEFDQVREAGKVSALLVTVFDVSDRVRLSRALAGAEQRAKTEIDLLLGILGQEPHLLTTFVATAEERLERINADLRAVRSDTHAYAELVERLFRAIHGLKGEAMTLDLKTITREAHACEDGLSKLRGRNDLSGEDFIPVAVAVNAVGEQIARVKSVLARMRRFAGQDETPARGGFAPMLRQIEGLAQRVATDLNKQVRFETSLPGPTVVPEGFGRFFHEALPQLVRNAVVHGIEPAEERLRAGKPAEGTVRVEIRPHGDGTLSLMVRDDGRGICVPTLRQRLVESGHKRAEEVEGMSDQQIIAALFQAGVSTAARIDEHAGRGVGLNLVSELATGIGAQLHIASSIGAFTEFTVSMRA